jgi:hypothetical protein
LLAESTIDRFHEAPCHNQFDHRQYRLFEGRATSPLDTVMDRMPQHPWATDNLHHGLHRARSKSDAADFKYVQLDSKAYVGTLLFDLDSRGALTELDNIHGPPPNFAVACRDKYSCHVGYVLRKPVHRYEAARPGPLLKASAAERGISRMLEHLGNDLAYGKLVTKTPNHAHWITIPLHPYAYTLDELIENLPAGSTEPARHITLLNSLGRNCTVFEELRKFSYRAAVRAKCDNQIFERFAAQLLDVASNLNRGFDRPLSYGELRSIARSVAKWSWRRMSPEKFSQLQRRRGQAGAAKRWARHTSTEASKPWEPICISRRTWYYRKAQAAKTLKTQPRAAPILNVFDERMLTVALGTNQQDASMMSRVTAIWGLSGNLTKAIAVIAAFASC